MAKGPIFWNNATGKLGNLVLSVRKGQQITRQYQPNVANPRTFEQTRQRIKFSNAGKFYKRAVTNFFIQAFEGEDKISAWNSFMKHNASLGALATRERYLDVNYPSVAPFVLSSGSLGTLNYQVTESLTSSGGLGLILPSLQSSDNTIGKVSTKILAEYPALLDGDVLTFVAVISRVTGVTSTPTAQPIWIVRQLTIDSASTANLPNEFIVQADEDDVFNLAIAIAGYDNDYCVGGAVIAGRKTATGVKATNSALKLNAGAQNFYNTSNSGAFETQALLSWGAVASDAVIV